MQREISRIHADFDDEQAMLAARTRANKARQRRSSVSRIKSRFDENSDRYTKDHVEFIKADHEADKADLKLAMLEERQRQNRRLQERLASRRVARSTTGSSNKGNTTAISAAGYTVHVNYK